MNYLTINQETGEVTSNVKYLKGQPKEYRFDGQQGFFKLGATPILDDKNKPLRSLKIKPLAFRVFEENLFGLGKKDLWFELFFVDDKNALSYIMFKNSSALALQQLQKELFYEDLSLCNVEIIVGTKDAKNDKGSWVKATFEYELLKADEFEELKQVEELLKPYSKDTLTETAIFSLWEGSFFSEFVEKMDQVKLLES